MISHEEEVKTGDGPKPVPKSNDENPVRIWIDIRISNGLHLFQKNYAVQAHPFVVYKEYYSFDEKLNVSTQ